MTKHRGQLILEKGINIHEALYYKYFRQKKRVCNMMCGLGRPLQRLEERCPDDANGGQKLLTPSTYTSSSFFSKKQKPILPLSLSLSLNHSSPLPAATGKKRTAPGFKRPLLSQHPTQQLTPRHIAPPSPRHASKSPRPLALPTRHNPHEINREKLHETGGRVVVGPHAKDVVVLGLGPRSSAPPRASGRFCPCAPCSSLGQGQSRHSAGAYVRPCHVVLVLSPPAASALRKRERE